MSERQADAFRRSCLAEGIGTFALVFAGTGAIVVNSLTGGGVMHVGVSLTSGFWLSGRLPGRWEAPLRYPTLRKKTALEGQ